MRQKHSMQTDFRKAPRAPAKTKEDFSIDYPQEGETVTGRDYTFRINAPQDAPAVELSINQGPWLPCRQASGYWWFDCTDMAPEPYQARARMRLHDGTEKLTLLRRFQARG